MPRMGRLSRRRRLPESRKRRTETMMPPMMWYPPLRHQAPSLLIQALTPHAWWRGSNPSTPHNPHQPLHIYPSSITMTNGWVCLAPFARLVSSSRGAQPTAAHDGKRAVSLGGLLKNSIDNNQRACRKYCSDRLVGFNSFVDGKRIHQSSPKMLPT